MFRKTIFWLHLGCGVATGLVIAMMSVTGVLLTYELQMFAWADRDFHIVEDAGASPRPLQEIVDAANGSEFGATRLTISSDTEMPVLVRGERGQGSLYIDPYTAQSLGRPSPEIRQFFSTVTSWHRWFDAGRENRDIARRITGVSNIVFLCLIGSGIYLWLPKIMRWPLFRARLYFRKSYKTSQERDFNWHHVFGLWSAIPLFVVVATAVLFSFSWASNLIYLAAGEEPPVRGNSTSVTLTSSSAEAVSLDHLVALANDAEPGWATLSVPLPVDVAEPLEITLDRGNGRQPQHRDKLIMNPGTGEILGRERFSDRSPATQARYLARFLHTGEALGVVGQTIAGIVSLASVFMVWTGFTLAFRRLVAPLLRRRGVTHPKASTDSAITRRPAN